MTKLRNLFVLTAASAFLLGAFIGCKKNSEPAPTPAKTLESIRLEVSPATLKVGANAELKVTATYSDKSTADVSPKATFTSTDTSVASVQGVRLTALKEGRITVIASYTEGGTTKSSASVSVTVQNADTPTPPTPEPEARTLVSVLLQTSPSPMNLLVNVKATLTAIAEYSDGKTDDVSDKATFASSDTSVATISGKTLTAVKAGTSKITATYKEGEVEKTSGESTVTVSEKESDMPVFTLESIEAGGNFTLTVGETKDITVTAKYKKKVGEVVTDESVTATSDATYHSSVTSVAEFDNDYKNRLKALSAGETVITVNYEDESKQHKSTTITVTVTPAPAAKTLESIKLSIEGSELTALTVNETKTLKVTATYSDKSTADVSSSATITSGNTDVASVEGTTLKGLKEGSATITAKYTEGDISKESQMTVTVREKTTQAVITVPDWTWNEGVKVFAWGWNNNSSSSENKDGSWIECSGGPEKSTTVNVDLKESWTNFLLVRCQKDTTEPKWDIKDRESNEPGRIYNKTKDIEIVSGTTAYTLIDSDFSDYPLVTLKVILSTDIESGKSIYFTGEFEEAKDSTGTSSWKTAVKGTNGGGDGKTWTCDVTIPRGSNTFEWKAIEGGVSETDSIVIDNIKDKKWQSDPNNRYTENKDSSGTITSITGDSVTDPNFN